MRAVLLLLLSVLLCACAANKPQQVVQDHGGPMHNVFPPQPVPASDTTAPDERLGPPAKPPPDAVIPPDTPPPMTNAAPVPDGSVDAPLPAGKIEVLDEMSSNTPGAPKAPPCTHYNCGTILSISNHKGLEDFKPGGDNGSGTYFAVDVPMGDAAAQPQDEGQVFEKEARLWEITVKMQDGTVQVIQQDYAPGVQVGDTVLVEDNKILPWN